MPQQQQHPQQRRPQRRRSMTPFRTRVFMAMFGVGFMLLFLYFCNDMQFPTEITYRNVAVSSVPYGHQREAPRGHH